MVKWLTAYRDHDEDTSIWPDTNRGLMHAEVKNVSEVRSLLELTADEALQLERDGCLYKDIDGVAYAIDLF